MSNKNNRKKDGTTVLLSRVLRDLGPNRKRTHARVLILGDSHAIQFYKHLVSGSSEDRSILFWLGPKLMHTIAIKGFGISFLQLAVLKIWRPQECLIWIGEIDVRMHMVKHMNTPSGSLEWVDTFFEKLVSLYKQLGEPDLTLFSPVPQVDKNNEGSEFPAFGSLSDRVHVQKELVSKCRFVIADRVLPIKYLDVTIDLQNQDGSLKKNLTDDNCHLNAKGFERVSHLWKKDF